jgi:beta-lactamase class A
MYGHTPRVGLRRSIERSYRRRQSSRFKRVGRAAGLTISVAGLAGLAWAAGTGAGGERLEVADVGAVGDSASGVAPRREVAYPSPANVRQARRYASRDEGLLSFAVIDSDGNVSGFEGHRQYVSASVVKAMLLAAELRRLRREGLELDPLTKDVLSAMITVSDNIAADEIYYRVGDEGLYEVARKAGMEHFSVSGYWANAQLTAVDMARYMRRLDRNLTGPGADWARNQLRSIAPEQRWGIPEVVNADWQIHFKGGWRSTGLGEMVHQVALLRHAGGTVVSLAVLSDGQSSQGDAIEDIRRIAKKLFARPPAGDQRA